MQIETKKKQENHSSELSTGRQTGIFVTAPQCNSCWTCCHQSSWTPVSTHWTNHNPERQFVNEGVTPSLSQKLTFKGTARTEIGIVDCCLLSVAWACWLHGNERGTRCVNMCVMMLCTIGYRNVDLCVHKATLSIGDSLCIAAVTSVFWYVIGGASITWAHFETTTFEMH